MRGYGMMTKKRAAFWYAAFSGLYLLYVALLLLLGRETYRLLSLYGSYKTLQHDSYQILKAFQ